MKKQKLILISLATGLLGLSLMTITAQTEKPQTEKPTPPFMRQKLDYARGVLEGITLENFGLVATNAQLLRNMNLTNTFSGLGETVGHVDYRRNVTNFQARVDSLIKAANEKSLERATAAFTFVTRECVTCHKDFRKEQFIRRFQENK